MAARDLALGGSACSSQLAGMITLYSHPLSLFAAKVRIALAEKALPYTLETVPLDAARGYHPKHPQVVRHNPKQQVPVLLHDELALYDSTVILEYLEDLAPEPALYPRSPQLRARCRLLELEADEVAFAPVRALINLRYATQSGADDDPVVRAQAASAFEASCARLAQHLGASDFLCERFSVADFAHFLVVTYGLSFGLLVPAQGGLQAWYARIAERPSIAAELASMLEAARAFGALQPGAAQLATAGSTGRQPLDR